MSKGIEMGKNRNMQQIVMILPAGLNFSIKAPAAMNIRPRRYDIAEITKEKPTLALVVAGSNKPRPFTRDMVEPIIPAAPKSISVAPNIVIPVDLSAFPAPADISVIRFTFLSCYNKKDPCH